MLFDLHVHTKYSDGLNSPHELIKLGLEKGLKGIAITDHDTIEAMEEVYTYSSADDFYIIPGIEFSAVYNDEEVHILGYFMDIKNKELSEIIKKLKESRFERGYKMLDKLCQLGLDVSIDELKEIYPGENIGRPQIARLLIKKAYCNSIEEAFDKYLNRGKSAYVERYKMKVADTINLIKKSSGIPVLAHPGLLKDKSIISYCINNGIQGIECIHPKHSEDTKDDLFKISKENGLIITGGSDFHGDSLDNFGNYYVDINNIPEFKERLKCL